MAKSIERTDYMLKYLKTNWKYWDDECMSIVKQHNGYGFHMFIALNNKLLQFVLSSSMYEKSLKDIENTRVFKLEKILFKDKDFEKGEI